MGRARTRTFSGCLTCRRRRVKCDSQLVSPCGNCQRLKLVCESAFSTNFISSNLGNEIVAGSQGEESLPSKAASRATSRSRSQSAHRTERRKAKSSEVPVLNTPSTLPFTNHSQLSFQQPALNTDIFIHNDFSRALSPEPFSQPGITSTDTFRQGDFSQSFLNVRSRADSYASSLSVGSYDSREGSEQQLETVWPFETNTSLDPALLRTSSLSLEPPPIAAASSARRRSISANRQRRKPDEFTALLAAIPPRNPQRDDSDADTQLYEHYRDFMTTFWTRKSSDKKMAKFLKRHPDAAPDSALQHSMYALAAIHLSTNEPQLLYKMGSHYSAASTSVRAMSRQLLREDLSIEPFEPKSIFMLLSTLLILSLADVLMHKPDDLLGRLQGLKILIMKEWAPFYHALDAESARALLSLAWIEIRVSLWKQERLEMEYNPRLLELLEERVALQDLYTKDQGRLDGEDSDKDVEMEVSAGQEQGGAGGLDTVQKEISTASLEAISVINRVKRMECRIESVKRRAGSDADADEWSILEMELRELQARISRLKLQCRTTLKSTPNLSSLAPPTSTSSSTISSQPSRTQRTAIKWMEILVLANTSTILLSHILTSAKILTSTSTSASTTNTANTHPPTSTAPNASAQASAYEIFNIAMCLQKMHVLNTSARAFLWPLPLFVAALEIREGWYREWAGGVLGECAGEWGVGGGSGHGSGNGVDRVGDLLRGCFEREGGGEGLGMGIGTVRRVLREMEVDLVI